MPLVQLSSHTPGVTSGSVAWSEKLRHLDQGATTEVQDITPVEISPESGQPPTMVKLREVPAAIEAREALLVAIAQETRTVVDKQPGWASSALVELAQAYALLPPPRRR